MVISEYPAVIERLFYKRLLIGVVSLVSVVALGLILSGLGTVSRLPYTGLSGTLEKGQVTEVPAGSPAEAAGLQRGDSIRTLNGISIDREEAYLMLYTGEPLLLTVEREGELLTTTVSPVAAPTSVFLARITPLAVALCFIFFGFGVWIYKPYDRTVVLYWAFSYLGATVLSFGTFSNLGLPWAHRWFGLAFIFLSPVFVHFHMHLAYRDMTIGRNLWFTRALYLAAFMLAVPWMSYEVPVEAQRYQLLNKSISLYFVTAILLSAYVLGRAYFSFDSLAQRRGVRLVIFGTVLAFVPLLFLSLLPDIFLEQEFSPYEVTFGMLLFVPMAYAVAIHQHNLLQLQRVVNRHSLVLLSFLVLIAVYLVVITNLPRFLPQSWNDSPFTWGVATLLLAAIFAPLRQLLQAIVDRLFYEGWYNYGSVVSEMSQRLRGVVNQDELAELLVTHLAETMRLDGAALLLLGEGHELVLVRAEGLIPPQKRLLVSGRLAKELQEQARPLLTPALVHALRDTSLTREEKEWLNCTPHGLWVPLVRQQTLHGILLLGERLDGDLLGGDDYHLLDTLASGAVTAAENVHLVRELSQRTAQVNLLYSQLLQSREAERKRLARDLHDRTIRDLVNLFHDLNLKTWLEPKVGKTVSELQVGLRATIDDLRLICSELRPAALDNLGLVLALQGYVDDIRAAHELDVSFKIDGQEDLLSRRLTENVKITFYRVLQEAVQNVLRHAGAEHVWIELVMDEDWISLEIKDDGTGFDPPPSLGAFTREHHFGLAGMRERLHLLGGSLTVSSSVGEGTCVKAYVKLSVAAEKDWLTAGSL